MMPTVKFGGVDGDSEINGFAIDDQFLDIVWQPASLDHGLNPLPMLTPLEETCADLTVAAEDVICVSEEPVEVA